MKIVVIGSGMSGLTAAAFLAQGGHDVTVYEQFSKPGGVTARLEQEGFGWDNGPLLLEGFGPGDRGTAVFEELGIAEQIQAIHEDRGLVLPDFSMWKPDQYEGPYWRKEHLKKLYPDESQNLERYYQFYDRMMNLMSTVRRLERAPGLESIGVKIRMALLFQGLKKYVNWNATQLMDAFFHTPALKAFFTGIVADFVTKPSEFPALGVPSIHLETAFDKRIPFEPGTRSARTGYFYLAGGCQSMVDAVMGSLSEHGGHVLTQRTVKKIMVENNQVKGVELEDGSFDAAECVLASGGANETFLGLVGKENLPEDFCASLARIIYMESVLMVHLGIDFDPRLYQPAALCYYYGTYDLEGAVERIRNGIYHGGKEGLLIYVPSLISPQLAPSGKYAVTIYTVVPDKLNTGSWEERREELADQLVAEAERFVPGLREHTLTRAVLTPADFRTRLHQDHHSFGGTPPIIGNKQPPHRTPIDGLWFIGAQSEGGGGILNVVIGARNVAKRILAEKKKQGPPTKQ
jgi:phytoene dehydrogenase-like protein